MIASIVRNVTTAAKRGTSSRVSLRAKAQQYNHQDGSHSTVTVPMKLTDKALRKYASSNCPSSKSSRFMYGLIGGGLCAVLGGVAGAALYNLYFGESDSPTNTQDTVIAATVTGKLQSVESTLVEVGYDGSITVGGKSQDALATDKYGGFDPDMQVTLHDGTLVTLRVAVDTWRSMKQLVDTHGMFFGVYLLDDLVCLAHNSPGYISVSDHMQKFQDAGLLDANYVMDDAVRAAVLNASLNWKWKWRWTVF